MASILTSPYHGIMMRGVRTTLSLDDDIAARLRDLAHRRRRPFKDVVNEVLRRGLAAQDVRAGRPQPFRVDVFRSAFRPGVDPQKLNQLSDELDVRGFGQTSSRSE